MRRYACDPRRLYEIWEGVRFPGARAKALELFETRYPSLLDRVDFGPHQRHAPDPPSRPIIDVQLVAAACLTRGNI